MRNLHLKNLDLEGDRVAMCRRLRCRGRSLLVLATTLLMVGCRDSVTRLNELGAEVTQDAHGDASVSCLRQPYSFHLKSPALSNSRITSTTSLRA